MNVTPGDLLDPQVRRLFGSLAHAGQAEDAGDAERWVHGEAGREARGTRVRFALRLRDGRVLAARYQAYGCPHTLAVCEWLAQELEAGRVALLEGPEDWSRRLGVPMVKLGRLLVVEDALRAVLAAGGISTAGSENVVK
jgi:hypothetical protein